MTAPKLRGSCSLQVCSRVAEFGGPESVTQAGVCGGVLATERFGAEKNGRPKPPIELVRAHLTGGTVGMYIPLG